MISHRLLQKLCGGFALIAVTLFFSSAAPGAPVSGEQGAASRQKPPKKMNWERMQRPLDLTDEQVAELRTIQGEQRETMGQLREDSTLSREQKRERFQELREAHLEEIASILTPAQQQKMQEMRKQRQEKKGAAPGQE